VSPASLTSLTHQQQEHQDLAPAAHPGVAPAAAVPAAAPDPAAPVALSPDAIQLQLLQTLAALQQGQVALLQAIGQVAKSADPANQTARQARGKRARPLGQEQLLGHLRARLEAERRDRACLMPRGPMWGASGSQDAARHKNQPGAAGEAADDLDEVVDDDVRWDGFGDAVSE